MGKKKGIFKLALLDLKKVMSKHTPAFVGLFILSILFAIFVGFVAAKFTIPVITQGQDMVESIQANIKTVDNPTGSLTIEGNQNFVEKYNQLKTGLVKLVFFTVLVWGICFGILLGLFNLLLKKFNFFSYLWRYIVLTFIYFIPAFLVVSWFVQESVGDVLFGSSMKEIANFSSLILILLIAYFAFISLSLLPSSFKNIFQRTWFVVKKGWHKLIGVYLLKLIGIGLLLTLIFYSTEWELGFLIFSIVLLLAWFYFGVLFIVLFVKRLEKEN